MALVVLFALLLLAATLPDLCPQALSLAAHPPDLWLVIVAYLAMRGRGFTAVGWAIVLGFVRDSLSLDPLGTHAFVLATVAWLFCEGRRHRSRIEGVTELLLTFGAALIAGWLYVVRLVPIGGSVVELADLWHAVPTAIWTTLLAAGLYPFLDRFHLLDDLWGRRRGLPA